MSKKGKLPKGPEYFINRELSWLAFNERVLEEAADHSTPLFERLKFAAIVSSNLDEFFMVRVASLQHALREGDTHPDPAGFTPEAQLSAISEHVHAMVAEQYRVVVHDVLPRLAEEGIRVAALADLDARQRAAASAYFRDEVLPALTPLAIDFARPFPMLASLSLNLLFLLAAAPGSSRPRLAVVQVPPRLSRLVRLAGPDGAVFVLLEDVIRAEAEALFPGQTVMESAVARLARDSELELDDEGGESYLEQIEQELRNRRRNDVVRLEVEAGASDALVDLFARQAGADRRDVYRVPGPLDLRFLWSLVELPGFDHLRDTALPPVPVLRAPDLDRIFDVLDRRDLLVHHPYESFDPVVALVEAAAEDPDVLAIKQTLYRTSGDSPIVTALTRAADQGKQVTVIVELMARFDEQRNIQWARRLEQAGAHVIYGIRGYKVHAKACLVVRRTAQGIRRYLHLGTGNYNDRTARLYTDLGLMTSVPEFGSDASAFFSALTGYSDPPRMRKLVMAPTQLRERLLKLIAREARRAESGQPAQIRAKMNSLVDVQTVHALYAAARAGVRIRLNVRGICTLRPGVPGLSDRIEVVSIVGRYLEHARIFHFLNGGDEEVYLASADWMTRNLDRRIELMFPIEDVACRRKVLQALDTMFLDNVKSRRLEPDGRYLRLRHARGEDPLAVQAELYRQARRAAELLEQPPPGFEPLTTPERPSDR